MFEKSVIYSIVDGCVDRNRARDAVDRWCAVESFRLLGLWSVGQIPHTVRASRVIREQPHRIG